MNSAQDDEVMRVQYKDPLSAAGWTIAWHAMTLDTRMSDGALRLYLLLHRYAQQSGMAWPSLSRLAADLGVSVPTVKRRLQELTTLGLIERRKEVFGGTTTTFLLDPREQYIQIKNDLPMGSNLSPLGPNGLKNEPSIGSNLSPKEIIIEELREEEEEKKAEKVENCARSGEIERALIEQGVFESAARQIAAMMADAGLSAEDAIRILRATIQSILSGMPRGDEEVMGLAISRLQRGIWDAGEQSRRILRRARYAGDSPPPPGPPPPPEAPAPIAPAPPDGVEKLWEHVLEALRLELPRATFETWLRPSRAVGRKDGTLIVQVANDHARGWVEGRLRGMVERAVKRVAGEPLTVQFVVEGTP